VAVSLSLLGCLLALVSSFPVRVRATSYACAAPHHEVVDAYFLDVIRGWLVLWDRPGHGSYIFQTRDGSRTWRLRTAPLGLYRLYFSGPRSGWGLTYRPASGVSGSETGPTMSPGFNYLVRTLDGGRTWTRISAHPITRDHWVSIAGLAFADSERGWACGWTADQAPVVLETSDGGKTFRVPSGLPRGTGPCYGVLFGPSVGLWIYGEGFVLHSGDGGKTWEELPDIANLGIDYVYSGFFFDDGRGWLAGGGPHWSVLSTTDFGRHWRPAPGTDPNTVMYDVWFPDPAHGCAAGESAEIFCTSDGGLSWSGHRVTLPAGSLWRSASFTKVFMLPSGRGWLLQLCGFLYRTSDGGETWRAFDPLEEAKAP
jgi:photosystem II stability/assembly factor-like uncharacterized protein